MISWFVELNKKISIWFDKTFLPGRYRVFGTGAYDQDYMPRYITSDLTVLDIGSGKHPTISANMKKQKNLINIGMDIDEKELKAAPEGVYDQVIVADMTQKLDQDIKGDLVLSRALLEHVPDSRAVLQNMYDLLNEKGTLVFFAPCKNAVYARLNMLLPDKFSYWLLKTCWPEKIHELGFKPYYNNCTPAKMEKMLEEIGFEIVEKEIFYASRYFEVVFPVHILWRLYQVIIKTLGLTELSEGFVFVARKPA